MTYPKCLSKRSGAKVGWLTYATAKEAVEASSIAMREADELQSLGYDFGFQTPGAITINDDGTFTVVIP
jgi:hypothetical protein